MKILAICRPVGGADFGDMASHIGAEAKLLEAWRDSGTLLEAYSPGGPGAVLVLDLPDLDEGRTLVDTLPLGQAGLIETELIALLPMQY